LTDFFKEQSAVTALGLAMMLAKNPKPNDKWDSLKDIFLMANKKREFAERKMNEETEKQEEKIY
jgi:hypothetical protein